MVLVDLTALVWTAGMFDRPLHGVTYLDSVVVFDLVQSMMMIDPASNRLTGVLSSMMSKINSLSLMISSLLVSVFA